MPAKKTIKGQKVKPQTEDISIVFTLIPTDLIDDNPYNSRRFYLDNEVDELGDSLEAFGLRQVPTGRKKDGRYQIAFGHKRLRAFRRNAKKDPKHEPPWTQMPVLVKELTDQQMFDYSLEENLRRSDVTPIGIARAIEKFTFDHPEVLDKDIAKAHNMSESNVSNMRRVLRLPQQFLDMIDKEEINLTQGRELASLVEREDAEKAMGEVITRLHDPARKYADTVEGIRQAINEYIVENGGEVKTKQTRKKKEAAEVADKNISQEKSAGQKAEPPAAQQPLIKDLPAQPAAEKEQPAAETKAVQPPAPAVEKAATSEAPKVTWTRKIVLEERPDGVAIILQSQGKSMNIQGASGNLESVIKLLPDYLKAAMAEWAGELGPVK